MQMRTLGQTKTRVPAIGLGTYRFDGPIAALHRGFDAGATLVDTAELYGNEALVGAALKGRRQQVVVATKCRALKYGEVIASADASLSRLACGVIDLFQIHFPSAAVPIADTMGALERLVEQGKVRYVGVSNFSVPELRAAQRVSRVPIVSNQVEYSVIERTIERELLDYCREQRITVLAYRPLGYGLDALTAHDPGGALAQVAAETNRTPAQVALAWCLAQAPVVVIPKAATLSHVDENCAASELVLSREQYTRLSRGIRHRSRGWLYRTSRRLARQLLQRSGLR